MLSTFQNDFPLLLSPLLCKFYIFYGFFMGFGLIILLLYFFRFVLVSPDFSIFFGIFKGKCLPAQIMNFLSD